MNARATIRKIFFVSIWLMIGAGLITLLAAAMRRQNNGHCSHYTISIKGDGNSLFIDKNEVAALLNQAAHGELIGAALAGLDLPALEKKLESNTWVEDAEIYFDSKNAMHVTIKQKVPIARIFTNGGDSYYIDSLLRKLPLSNKVSAQVPVFTGFPDRGTWLSKDSLLVREVKAIAQLINRNEFWKAQVSQVNIEGGKFELIPVVGDHLVKLGNGTDLQDKFNRLFLFYKKVLVQAGLSKYQVIDVQYKQQVIATSSAERTFVDSVQLRNNVEKLLRTGTNQLKEANEVTINNPGKNVNPSVETSADPNAVKTTSVSPAKEKDAESRIPKAVMPPPARQNTQENKNQEQLL